jgi:broad-specificity NMP kinase
MNKRYYITGVSGTGKTTVCEELAKRGFFAIDQDSKIYALCSWKHNQTKEDARFEYGIGKEFLEANDWYCDIEKLKALLDTSDTISFVCGVTANQDEYLNLFDKVFLLQCPPGVFSKRIDERENNQFGKHPSEKEHLLEWYKELEDRLIAKGAVVINCDAPTVSIAGEILRHIE